MELLASYTHDPADYSLLTPPQPKVSSPFSGSLQSKEFGFAQRGSGL